MPDIPWKSARRNQRSGASAVHHFVLALLLGMAVPAMATPPADPEFDDIAKGIGLRQSGQLGRAVEVFKATLTDVNAANVQIRAVGELGITQLQARNFEEAGRHLTQAYDQSTGALRAHYAVYLGNLALLRKQSETAKKLYQEAADLVPGDVDIQLIVGLNLAKQSLSDEKLSVLRQLSGQLGRAPYGVDRARQHLNLGNQAMQAGPSALKLAYQHLEQARQLAKQQEDKRLQLEAYDDLAQLYENQRRYLDAWELTSQAIELAGSMQAGESSDLLINLQWRQARLLQRDEKTEQALASYMRAIATIELVRQDIPIEYEDGRSSFRATLEPIYMGFADLVLRQLDQKPPSVQASQLKSVVHAVEMVRQTEMQDFLGDRCVVESVQGNSSGVIAPHTALLYPLALPDRLELLLLTSTGIERRTVSVTGAAIRRSAEKLSDALRNGVQTYRPLARQLNDWLIKPFDEALKKQDVQSLVVVPDGALRLVPMGALFDGKQYAIERFAVSTVTGASMTNTSIPSRRNLQALVVGLSEPGSVVDKLDQLQIAALPPSEINSQADAEVSAPGLAKTRQLRAIRGLASLLNGSATDMSKPSAERSKQLSERYALPGVAEEVAALGKLLPGTSLLNAEFTVGRFTKETEFGEYRIVHIASHGIFGGSADTSFIMAHDDLLTMNSLQSLLKSEKFQRNPIELLTLSACETAEGNDRAPLGIAGAAMKARAKSVVGTLWPVEDNAAKTLMTTLYTGITAGKLTKTEALRQAQLALLRNPESRDPFYWAPFVLIGDWQ